MVYRHERAPRARQLPAKRCRFTRHHKIIRRTGTATSFPRRTPSLPNANAALRAGNGMEDEIFETRARLSTNSLSNSSAWSTKENRVHGQDPDASSLRSEDPSVKGGDVSLWWEGRRLLAVVRKVILCRPVMEIINASEGRSESETEKANSKRASQENLWVKHKLQDTHPQGATQNDQSHGVRR